MEKYIFKYLDEKYTLGTSSVGNTSIYLRLDDSIGIKVPYNGSKLCKELSTIFGFEVDEAISYINTWALKDGPVNLEFYWEYHSYDVGFDTGNLPLARRVAASTISQDLVRVEPLSAPTGRLMYFDTVYTGGNNNNNVELEMPKNLFKFIDNGETTENRLKRTKEKWINQCRNFLGEPGNEGEGYL